VSVKVYGCNHIAIEVGDVEKAVAFYQDLFNLEKLNEGEGDAFFKLGEHQFLAIFEVKEIKPDRMRPFGIMVRDERQLTEVREKRATLPPAPRVQGGFEWTYFNQGPRRRVTSMVLYKLLHSTAFFPTLVGFRPNCSANANNVFTSSLLACLNTSNG